MAEALLSVKNIEVIYDHVILVLKGVSLQVEQGKIVALLGANGAGKTTVARVCSGLVTPSSGTIRFDGRDLTGRRAHEYARAGIVHAVEGRSVFGTLTVEENLVLALARGRRGSELSAAVARAYDLFPRLGERRDQAAGTMSGGEQRMLSLARVLVDAPRLLIADELSLGLAPIIVDEVYATLEQIRASGTTLLLVEQHVTHALAIADTAVVLEKGRVEFAGAASEARGHVGI